MSEARRVFSRVRVVIRVNVWSQQCYLEESEQEG